MSDRQKEEDDEREDHLHVSPWGKAEEAHNQQLRHLTSSELMDFALWDSANVVIRRVSGLMKVVKLRRNQLLIYEKYFTCSIKRRVMRSNI